mmetsp:Transcript_24255/g.31572  ORF Transcript_24255/g.31572 Transcript_24255/m.31572 type:complete len:220 (-) Transcript_24255:79-738(-)
MVLDMLLTSLGNCRRSTLPSRSLPKTRAKSVFANLALVAVTQPNRSAARKASRHWLRGSSFIHSHSLNTIGLGSLSLHPRHGQSASGSSRAQRPKAVASSLSVTKAAKRSCRSAAAQSQRAITTGKERAPWIHGEDEAKPDTRKQPRVAAVPLSPLRGSQISSSNKSRSGAIISSASPHKGRPRHNALLNFERRQGTRNRVFEHPRTTSPNNGRKHEPT